MRSVDAATGRGGHAPDVVYASASDAERAFRDELNRLLAGGVRRICDVGGGARPAIVLDRIREQQLDYLVVDASEEELARTPAGYGRRPLDILDTSAVTALAREHGPFDMVLSRWTAEHMPDGQRFHENVRRLLGPQGVALHYFPTLYALPFLVNRLLSEDLSSKLLFGAFSRRHAKFPAHYSWCRGPSRAQIERLQRCGYRVERYYGFFGHGFYARVPPLARLHTLATRWLVGHPIPAFTSFAVVSLSLE